MIDVKFPIKVKDLAKVVDQANVNPHTMNDNKLIAEFMGLEYKNGFLIGRLDTPKYHTSWDWLMPVVDKINGFTDDEGEFLYEVEINPSRCIISSNDPAIKSTMVDQPNGEDMKQVVYIAVVQFINKLN